MTLDRRLATVRSRVISLRSWYLTSLVNLSFYRFTISHPILWRISVITDIIISFPLSGMLLCVGLVFIGRIVLVYRLNPVCNQLLLQRPKISNSHSLYSSRRYWHLHSRCFCYCLRWSNILLIFLTSGRLKRWLLSLGSLPVHWYHLLCLKINTEKWILQYGKLYKMHYKI